MCLLVKCYFTLSVWTQLYFVNNFDNCQQFTDDFEVDITLFACNFKQQNAGNLSQKYLLAVN
jgi:hypothetical protein